MQYIAVETSVYDPKDGFICISSIGPFERASGVPIWARGFREELIRLNDDLGAEHDPIQAELYVMPATPDTSAARDPEEWTPRRTAEEIGAQYRTIHGLPDS